MAATTTSQQSRCPLSFPLLCCDLSHLQGTLTVAHPTSFRRMLPEVLQQAALLASLPQRREESPVAEQLWAKI